MNVLLNRALGLLEHLLIDEESDRLLVGLVTGLLAPAERLSLIAHGDPDAGIDPLQAITDPGVAPLWALPYAAQWTGGTMPPQRAGETDDTYLDRARAEVLLARGMLRGSPRGYLDLARSHAAPDAVMRFVPRLDDDRWEAGVLVRTGDVADPVALEAELNDPDVVVAGLHIEVRNSDAPLIDEATRTIDDATGDIDTATLPDIT